MNKVVKSEDYFEEYKNPDFSKTKKEFLSNLLSVNSPSYTDVINKFSDIRLEIGQCLKLDHVCFLLGNGCTVYAGSKKTTDFNILDVVNKDELGQISDIVDKIKNTSMEEQLNVLLDVSRYYSIVVDSRKVLIDDLISRIKKHLIDKYVNSVNYSALQIHETLLLKLRSFGCLSKTYFFTPNYDMALEYVFDKYGIGFSNGFNGFVYRRFDPRTIQNTNEPKIIKIHGSVSWIYDGNEKTIKEIQPSFSSLGLITIPDAEHVLIYPTEEKQYETYNAPYSNLMRSMLDCFESKRNVIIVLGYRYADKHINEILLKAMSNPNNVFYFFDYNDGECDFIKQVISLSDRVQNINVFTGSILGDFAFFVKCLLPSNPEKTDEEKIAELLNKYFPKKQ